MDIKPPPKRVKKSVASTSHSSIDLPFVATPLPVPAKAASWSRRQWLTFGLAGAAVALIAASLSIGVWYQWAIQPRSDKASQVRVVVEPGQTSASISETLFEHDLIKSRLAFNIYIQLSGQRTKLQAGGYVLSPNQDVPSIVEHMTTGKTDEFDITIPPGLTLEELRAQFVKNGFNEQEVIAAFNATYDHPLLADRPAGSTLEGYIYPETYRMNADQTVKEILVRSFDELYSLLQEKKYIQEYQKRNLTIHEGLTLASIVQQEVKDPTDQKQVAQVFLKRLKEGVQLGSDVTYMYAAEQMGVKATPRLDSPYNTRKYVGLPPGPISNMNPSALEAVAFPAPGDFLFFVAGDDGKTYFSHTEKEHEANIRAHCTTLCQ